MSTQQATTPSPSPSPSRFKASSKLKDSPTPRTSNSRAKSVSSPDVNSNKVVRRSLGLSKQPKSAAEQPPQAQAPLPLGSQKGAVVVGRPGCRPAVAVSVEQFARPRRHQRPVAMDPTFKKIEDDPSHSHSHSHGNNKKMNLEQELQEKLQMSQSLILNLESELLNLKAELDKARGFNMELQSHNNKLTQDLASAEAKIQADVGSQFNKNSKHSRITKTRSGIRTIQTKLVQFSVKQALRA